MKPVKSMTDREVLNELQSQSLLARVRAILSSSAAGIEQACSQRRMPSPIEIKRMEFATAEKILSLIRDDMAKHVPSVEDFDEMHDAGDLGDLYIWCQKMRELIVEGTESESEVR